jgi:hypothetical protein
MDPILIIVIVSVVILIVVGLIIYLGYSLGKLYKHNEGPHPKTKVKTKEELIGEEGEREVANELNRIFQDHHRLINDFLFYDPHGNSHEIDHIEINDKGVFVIETKSISGIVQGSEEADQWTKIIGPNTFTFYNPLKQNQTHMKALDEVFIFPCQVCSLVVFVNNNANGLISDSLCNLKDLDSFFERFNTLETVRQDQIEEIYQGLLEYQGMHPILKEDHNADIRRNHPNQG